MFEMYTLLSQKCIIPVISKEESRGEEAMSSKSRSCGISGGSASRGGGVMGKRAGIIAAVG